jgi:hypothetical protein
MSLSHPEMVSKSNTDDHELASQAHFSTVAIFHILLKKEMDFADRQSPR